MQHMDMPSEPMCNMNMLFTWDTTNLCIVFRWWHITSTTSLLLSLAGVALLTAGYELVRDASRKYEVSSLEYLNKLPTHDSLRSDGSSPRLIGDAAMAERRTKLVKAGYYAIQVFYSFFIMLLFMTYNGWIMLAVAIGAFFGYLAFGNSSPTKSVACH